MDKNDVYEFDDVLSWRFEKSTDPMDRELQLAFLVSWKGFSPVILVALEPCFSCNLPKCRV